jgi:hypothetical protein
MGSISIVHGIIIVEDINLYKAVVNSLNVDENYPWIRPEMWNLCGEERPYYYENPIATFGATYKNLDGGVSWSEFILKFENILSQIKFDFARVRLETEFMGDYEFFWGAKKNLEIEFYPKDLIECNKWFFGYGRRHMFGGLSEEKPSLPFEFKYPIEFNQEIKERFNALIPELNKMELNTKVYFKDCTQHIVFGNDHSRLILTYLKIHKMIHYGWEHEKGLYIERLDEINEINTPYSSK